MMSRKPRQPIQLHPEFLKKNGKNEFVVLPFEEFEAVREQLENAKDLMTLREAIRNDNGKPGLTLEELKARLDRRTRPRRRKSRS